MDILRYRNDKIQMKTSRMPLSMLSGNPGCLMHVLQVVPSEGARNTAGSVYSSSRGTIIFSIEEERAIADYVGIMVEQGAPGNHLPPPPNIVEVLTRLGGPLGRILGPLWPSHIAACPLLQYIPLPLLLIDGSTI